MMKTNRFFPFVAAVVATLTAAGGAHGQRTPVPTPSPADAASPTDERTYELSEVEEPPRPTNSADFARRLMRNYPPEMQAARVPGMVQARFRILEDGSVDSASISIISTENERFNEPTIRVLPGLRFQPAKVGGRPVKVWVILPIDWAGPPVESPPSQATQSAPAAPSGQSGETYELARVTELPHLTNASAFQRALAAGYPPALREARVPGRVEARFRVLEDGSVDSASVTITLTDNVQFSQPTIDAIRTLRFRPAKVRGRPVNVWVEIPVAWTPPA